MSDRHQESVIGKVLLKEFFPIVFRNVFSLITLIIITVVSILLYFHQIREGLFLGSAIFLNVTIGIIQELRAKIALEKLQALTAQKVHRIKPNGEEDIIGLDDICVGDILKLITGDQIPTDGIITDAHGLEVNEALLTGESDNIPKKQDQEVFAGSIVAAGHAFMRAEKTPKDSYVVAMTNKIKKFSINLSPIQRSIVKFIRIMTIILIIVVGIILVRGKIAQAQIIHLVKEIAALTGGLVPEGLVLAITLLFTYGAVRLFKGQLLLQEINSTEGLGRIYNLCVDKTGTLTENEPYVEKSIAYKAEFEHDLAHLTALHLRMSDDSSTSGNALKKFLFHIPLEKYEIQDMLAFSSERKYAATEFSIDNKDVTLTLGAPDILLSLLSNEEEKTWIEEKIAHYGPQAKRILLAARSEQIIDVKKSPTERLTLLGIFILENPLRPGTKDIIDFFQKRGVQMRVISGDNPHTVQAVAKAAGIHNTQHIATGNEIDTWEKKEFSKNAHNYHLFARIRPEQKERLVKAFKKSGFTAMVGDGANDALAIKRADLGIAMFDGAASTRQIAKIVLMNNSFALLPTGVRLSDSIISTIEMVGSIFFHKVTTILTLFITMGLIGSAMPIGPTNMTIINYCIIGFPVFYWAAFPANEERSIEERHFLKKVMPMSALNGLLTALACMAVFLLTKGYLQEHVSSTPVVLTFASLGYWFFLQVPNVLEVKTTKRERIVAYGIGIAEMTLFAIVFSVPLLSEFFGLTTPTPLQFFITLSIILLTAGLQYLVLSVLFEEKHMKKIKDIFSLE